MGRLLLLLLAVTASPERKEIETLIARFNTAMAANDFEKMLVLFTKDGDYGVGTSAPGAVAAVVRKLPPRRIPWDERMPLTMKVLEVRFIRPDVAIADAAQSDYAPMGGTVRQWSCTFIVVRAGPDWKIASYRETAK